MASKGLEIIMGAAGKKPPPGDDAPDSEPDMAAADDDLDACHDVWDAIQASDEDAFCRALKAAITAYK